MNYELALKLKNAGFPYKQSDTFEMVTEHNRLEEQPLTCRVPTLPELLDECSTFPLIKEFILRKVGPGWLWIAFARASEPEKFTSALVGAGKTPEIAVANLWLSINKNKK
jgi:hypothetical protein